MMGVGKDEIINWLYGKDEDWEDEAVDNLLKLFLLIWNSFPKLVKIYFLLNVFACSYV